MLLKLVQVAFFACLSVMVTAEGQECMTDECKEHGNSMLQASEQALRRQALLQESDFERNTHGPRTCGAKGRDETPWTAPKGNWGAKIVNGQRATECEWPWQASLRQGDFPFCGGTLIHRNWVFTAAHCVPGMKPDALNVVLGDFDVSTKGTNEKSMSVKKIISHPSYNDQTMSHDFALIELNDAAPLGTCIGVACLPSTPIQRDQECYITGWGTLTSGGGTPDFLQEAQVKTLDNGDCDSKNGAGSILDNMLCAQGRNKDGEVTDGCQGDSGGPLVCADSDGKYSVHGATSWGFGCAVENKPGVWARTTSVLEWIRGEMGGGPPAPAPAPYAAFASSIVRD